MTVYAVTPIRDDTTPALQFGDIRHINLRYVYGDEIENRELPADVQDKLQQAAQAFNPERDFVLIAGDHLQLFYFVAALARRRIRFCALRWDKMAQGYIPVWI